MKKKKLSMLIGTGAILGTGAVVGSKYLITKKLVSAAMDRELPKNMRNKHEDPPTEKEKLELAKQLKASEEKLLNSNTETVQIISYDGLTLVGHLHTCENPKRIIIAMHGWRSSWASDFGAIADFWHENDCMVLYAEQRSQGQSEGEHMSFGLNERYDCLAWINFMNEYTGGHLPIYLGGISMGATTVLMTAGLDLPSNVRGIAADCGFTAPDDIWQYIAQNSLHMSYDKTQRTFAESISKQKIGVGVTEYSTVEAMKNCKVPILFIHGTDDKFVPIEMTYQNYKACTGPKYLLVVPGADHGMSYIVNKDAYEDAVRKMWAEYD